MAAPLLTVGHGRLDRDELADLLLRAGVQTVVDVRRFPGSRANEAAARGAVEEICHGAGIRYHWEQRLGGRRSLAKEQDAASPDTWWRVKAFRAYAAWTRTEEFRVGLNDLTRQIEESRTAIMCSESVWWRCHRRIIADVVALEHDVPVEHLMPSGDLRRHEPSAGARVGADGRVVWDGQDTGQAE